MPIHITRAAYSAAVGVTKATTGARLRTLPYTDETNARQYHLASVLPTVRLSERGCTPALFAAATEEPGAMFVGEGVLPICHRLIEWLDSKQRARFYKTQVDFSHELVRGLQTSSIFEHLDCLRLKLVLVPGILRFVVLNDPKNLPDFKSAFTLQWAIVNARFEPIFEEMETV